MEKKKKIQIESKELTNEIEKKLYCIKENNFIFDEDFKKVYNFEFSLILENEIGEIFIKLEDTNYFFSKESRIINFFINNESQKRFIISYKYLKDVFGELKIEYYSTKSNQLEDSLDSEVSDEEMLKIFKNIKIVNIFKILTNCDKIIDKFNERYPDKIEVISNLSLNAKFYYPNNSNDKINFSQIDKYSSKITKFICDESNCILYLIGPKGSSKSINSYQNYDGYFK